MTDTLLFLHIPKTAGLTMRQILARNYPSSATLRNRPDRKKDEKGGVRMARVIRGETDLREGRGARNRAMERQIDALLESQRRAVRLVMGHFWFGLHDAFEQPCTYITILRDPVERVLSLYNHRLLQHDLAMRVDDYVRSERDFAMDNEQVRRLVGPIDGADIRRVGLTDEFLEVAKRNLADRFTVAGLTERFDESLVLMGRRYGWERLGYTRENVASKRVRRGDLTPDVLAAIEEHNRYDAELYRYASERLDTQLRELADLQRRLEDLRAEKARMERVKAIPLVGAWQRLRDPEQRLSVRDVVSRVASAVRPARSS